MGLEMAALLPAPGEASRGYLQTKALAPHRLAGFGFLGSMRGHQSA